MKGNFLWFILLIAFIFSFIVKNIAIIGIAFLVVSVLFVVAALIGEKNKKEKDELLKIKKEKETIYNNAKQKFDDSVKLLFDTKDIIIKQLEEIDSYVDGIKYQDEIVLFDDEDDQIEAINDLQNILKNSNYSNAKNIWNILYNDSEYQYINPLAELEKKISEIDQIQMPDLSIEYEYLEIIDNSIPKPTPLRKLYDYAINAINNKIQELREKYKERGDIFNSEYQAFENKKKSHNSYIDSIKNGYFLNEKEAIESYYKSILETATYYKHFSINVVIEYNPINKVLIVEYLLPSIDDFPKIKKRQYIKTRNEFKDIYFSDRELNKIFEDTTYQIVLDIIKKVFVFDSIDQIKTVVFNGWSKSINKATGLINEACILSVSTNKDEFLKINLPEVDPKECFKGLKGISAHKISNLTPIKPIITINQDDKRFVSAYNVEVDSSTNLASMHWEDFEHLIREIFEKEFTSNGGNVKVTQSSRDGGVDAIAFDPDPIRGGKIVIQAKRYTNVVGVSAVRDLYGTVLNEGATKGILVTTSDYGSDSYNFAKDKPITLLNGSNLLHLLEKHNYKARINIKEAREEINKF